VGEQAFDSLVKMRELVRREASPPGLPADARNRQFGVVKLDSIIEPDDPTGLAKGDLHWFVLTRAPAAGSGPVHLRFWRERAIGQRSTSRPTFSNASPWHTSLPRARKRIGSI
jgi:hypothetical protein